MATRYREQWLLNPQSFKFSPLFGLGGCARAVVQVQTEERQGDATGLERRGAGAKPDDCDDDDENAFYQRSDAVGDGGDEGEQDESEDVLSEVEYAVEEKFEGET